MSCSCDNKLKVKIKADYELKYAKAGDIGLDIRANEDGVIPYMETKVIPSGVYVELEDGVECQVRPRSGLSSKGIIVHFGTVDTGYRGEIGISITNLSQDKKDFIISKGTKLAQLVFKKYQLANLEYVEEINKDTERGTDGFGSTDKVK